MFPCEIAETHDLSSPRTAFPASEANPDPAASELFRTLHTLGQQHSAVQEKLQQTSAPSEVLSWLERTPWMKYTAGHRLCWVAPLDAHVTSADSPALATGASAMDRLVGAAYRAVWDDRINFFGLRCISSFLPRREMYSQPLLVKLHDATYKRRWGCQADIDVNVESEPYFAGHIDDACLDLCIALLQHDLRGDRIGIDECNGTFQEAQNYTPLPSGFIKISQMLVLLKALRAAKTDSADEPLETLDGMREEFMTIGCRSPLSWAVQLRSFGKQIRESTTSIGYIEWSEDERKVFYACRAAS
ncbi:hypothetical protein LTR32_002634 [Rachicladosporium monterosium]|uniref:Uncharacterized protein n=1 Tax=Rachicladosporium monterosium TaxID=1507873 RepID=A0ABR0L9T9_9PEZI|nr:hypothetical protein LTR32_002634 [Rachicladosporium monterosium]